MTTSMTPQQRKAITQQLGEVKPATDGLLGHFAESVANIRNHEHPAWEDLYCMNLTSYMGERVAPVLRRLLDAETEVDRLGARVAEHERSSAEAERNTLRQSFMELAAQAREDRDHESVAEVERMLRDREEEWKREDASASPRDLRPGAEAARRMLHERQTAEDLIAERPVGPVPAEVLADVVAGVIRDYDRDTWDATGNQVEALRRALFEYRDRAEGPAAGSLLGRLSEPGVEETLLVRIMQDGKEEYRFCGAPLGRDEYPFTCNRRVAHQGVCSGDLDSGLAP